MSKKNGYQSGNHFQTQVIPSHAAKVGNLSPIPPYRNGRMGSTHSPSLEKENIGRGMEDFVIQSHSQLSNSSEQTSRLSIPIVFEDTPIISEGSPSNLFNKQIDSIVRCCLCAGKPVSPHLCPCCQKIVCLPCIKKWISDQGKSVCPHCRASLSLNQLVNCRFVTEISTEIEKLQTHLTKKEKVASTPRTEHCSSHELPLIYYCETCKEPICSDCAMFEDRHRSHKFKKVSEVYRDCCEVVKSETISLKSRLRDLNTIVSNLDENIKRVNKAKEEVIKTINETAEEMKTNIETMYKNKLNSLVNSKTSINDEVTQLERLAKDLIRQIDTSPQCVLISKTPEIIRIVSEINEKAPVEFQQVAVSDTFPNEMIPSFEGGEFIIENFFTLLQTIEVIYSEPITINGLQWRLKVYPNGTGIAKGVFVSVFLEMFKGLTEPRKYHYKVEMVNRRDPSKNMERTFASVFDSGECWGYNRFYRVSELTTGGFVDTEDSTLRLKFFVRPANYFEKCYEQAKYIKQLEEFKASVDMVKQAPEEQVVEEPNISPANLNNSVESPTANTLQGIIEVIDEAKSLKVIHEGESETEDNDIEIIDSEKEEASDEESQTMKSSAWNQKEPFLSIPVVGNEEEAVPSPKHNGALASSSGSLNE